MIHGGFRLSPLQEHLWRLFEAQPRAPWCASVAIDIRGALDAQALERALAESVQRHEILRSRFVRPGKELPPSQVVDLDGRPAFTVHDLAAHDADERVARVLALERELRRPCTLDGDAPLRAALVRCGAERHELLLAQPALAADWRSLWNLAREVVRRLAGARDGTGTTQFADVAQWQQDLLAGDDAHAGREFWSRTDLAAARELRLPLEFDRGTPGFEPSEVLRTLSPELEASLRAFARVKRLPVSAILCAAWAACLARHAERADVVIGRRASGRAFDGLEELLGTFQRFLPVGVQLEPKATLARVARLVDETSAHGEEWFEFFDVGAGEPDPFRYAFDHLEPVAAVESGGLALELLRRGGESEPFRALLTAEERAREIRLALVHDARFLTSADAECLLDEVVELLASALHRPDAPLSSLSLCSGAMRARILDQLARGPGLVEQPRCLHEWILATARARPDALAAVTDGAQLTYGELDARSDWLGAALRAAGAGPGTLVGVHLERSLEQVVALLAVLRTGAAYVPLPPSWPSERLAFLVADSSAPIVVGRAGGAAALEGFRGTWIDVDHVTPAAELPDRLGTPDDLAYVLYTSGSSGRPKGVPVTHASLCASTRARCAYYRERVGKYLLLSSFAFDSSVAGLFWTLVDGGTLVLPPEGLERDLADLPALVARHRPTHVLALPSLWALVLEQASAEQLASLGTVIVAGESCPAELVRRHRERVHSARLFNEYGPTEGTVWSTVFDASRSLGRADVPIGTAIPGASAYVLTPEREPAAIGLAGELWIGGPGIARGYLGLPELTAERFTPNPFGPGQLYRTGDRARLLPDGNLEFLGRLDRQVKIRGVRVELGEIETALAAHPMVREAAVLARTDDGAPAQLVGYVSPIGSAPSEAELRAFLAQRLPDAMVPVRVLLLEHWPVLPNGKVDRRALPAPADEPVRAVPRGALEIVLAALWADVLGRTEVGRHDDFFALGGHSLSATRLFARIRETLQVSFPLRLVFDTRTPAALAEALRALPGDGARVERLAEVVLSILDASDGERAVGA